MAETPAPDPQAILKSLEIELAMKRQQRSSKTKSRTTMRVVSLLAVFLILGIALLLLSYLAQTARDRSPSTPVLPAIVWPITPLFANPF